MTDALMYVTVRLQNAYAGLRSREEGQTLTEYALIVAVVALGVTLAIVFLRDEIKELFSDAGNELNSQPAGS